MAFPTPGKPVRGSKTGVPIMAIFDLIGRTWAMGVVWQLQNGPFTFRELQSKCDSISPTILNSRIKELSEGKIIERTIEGYQLTDLGKKLVEIIRPMGTWARDWAKEVFDYNEMPKEY